MMDGLPLVGFPMPVAYPANMPMASYPPYQTSFPPASVSTISDDVITGRLRNNNVILVRSDPWCITSRVHPTGKFKKK